jgi:hypothetical protein
LSQNDYYKVDPVKEMMGRAFMEGMINAYI